MLIYCAVYCHTRGLFGTGSALPPHIFYAVPLEYVARLHRARASKLKRESYCYVVEPPPPVLSQDMPQIIHHFDSYPSISDVMFLRSWATVYQS